MGLVTLETKIHLAKTPRLKMLETLSNFSKHEIDCMTDRELAQLARGIPWGAAGFVDTVEQKLLDHFFTDPAYSPPTTLYLGLSSTTPTEAAGNVTEPSGGSYARLSTVSSANANPDWSAASGTAPATKVNTATFTFATASADWLAGANLTYAVIYDALTVGNLLAFGALGTAKPILNGDTASFAASAITFQMGDPGDTY